MKISIWLWVMISIHTEGFCQRNSEIDSLKNFVSNSSAHSEIDLANAVSRLAWNFSMNSQPDSAIFYYKKALSIQISPKEIAWRGNIHFGLGSSYGTLSKLDSSIFHYKKASVAFAAIGDSANIATTFTNLSIVYKSYGLYEEALLSALQALKTLEKSPPSFALASCYNNIGGILLRIKNYPDGLSYHRKALAVRLKIDQPLEVAKSYNNLGELYILTRQYDSAKVNLRRAAEIKRQLNDNQGLARTLNRLGKAFILTGDTTAARIQLEESLHTQRQLPDSIGLIETLNNLGELYLITSQLKRSKKALAEANTLIHHSGTPEYLRQNLELRIRLARQQKDFANGVILLEELLIIRDSLLNEEKSKSLQAMQIRYETQKKEQAIALLEQREETNQARIHNNRIFIGALILGLVLAATVGALIYINLKNTRAAKVRFQLLLVETQHRIKNNFQMLASIFHLQTRYYTDHEMVLEARNSESRIHAMSMLHKKFYAPEADHIVSTREYVTDLVHKLTDIYQSQTPNLKLLLNVDDADLDIDKALALSLIIQELVCNAFKYAFDHEPNPELSIQLLIQGDHLITTIHDNGVGFDRQPSGNSHGLSLVDALVAQLDGNMQIENQAGTTFIIRFPVTSLWKKRAFL